jgi:hypothetical protein
MKSTNRSKHAKKLTNPHEPVYEALMMLLNTVPVVGPATAMLAGRVWPDPGQAARDRFMVELAERVDSLFEQPQIEDALGRPETPALLSHALNMASRSFGVKKLRALREATINGIFHSPGDVDLAALVFGVLDRLTDGHITMLRAIADSKKTNPSPLRWDEAKVAGLEVRYSPDGMKAPRTFAPDQNGTRYFDQISLTTAEIVLADLVDLGLVEERFQQIPSIYEWSTDASKNLPGYAWVTAKGSLVLEHIETIDESS